VIQPFPEIGPRFDALLRANGIEPFAAIGKDAASLTVPHATTCVAIRAKDGVVIAGDRRATSGNLISHREMDKVMQADTFSAVAIAGAAGTAMEMVKLFQLQIEHYEKVEGQTLSLEGKANQLSLFVRNNLPAAMQGLMVVPIFAGYEPVSSAARIWAYDATGGRYEEKDFVATGSGMLHASTTIRLGWKSSLTLDAAVELACRSLWQAAEADSATGGYDPIRGIYPTVATIDRGGFAPVGESVLSRLFTSIAEEVKNA
jgi:proteasome beta subunit